MLADLNNIGAEHEYPGPELKRDVFCLTLSLVSTQYVCPGPRSQFSSSYRFCGIATVRRLLAISVDVRATSWFRLAHLETVRLL